MNQQEAHELIDRLIFCTQKMKSNAIEAIAGHDEPTDNDKYILNLLVPRMMGTPGHLNILDALIRYSKKEILEPIDMFNALSMCEGEPMITFKYSFTFDEDMPSAKKIMVQMMMDDNDAL